MDSFEINIGGFPVSTLARYLTVLFVSMVPLIELRGAVPIGTAFVNPSLEWYLILIVAIIGNCLPIPFILLFVKAVLTWMRGEDLKLGRFCVPGSRITLFNKISCWLFEKAVKNRPKIDKYGAFGLFLFVAIPLPGTGAWTGALVASIFDMKKSKSYISIFAGVVCAGLIMTFGSQLVKFIVELF